MCHKHAILFRLEKEVKPVRGGVRGCCYTYEEGRSKNRF